MAVTKTVPAADVAVLLDLGLTLFGENRVQEAGAKVAEVAALRPAPGPRWHFIGGLQRNKARAVVAWADRVESVDSVRLADALDRAAARACDDGRRTAPLPVLLQYSVDGDPERGGVARDGLLALADHVAWLRGAAPRGAHGRRAAGRRPRNGLRGHRRRGRRLRSAHPAASALSAGMSGDLEVRHPSRFRGRACRNRPSRGIGR